ncbi:MAG: hypothetical protein ACRDL7_08775, partial [Gaiellaceae bacterium]
TNSAAISDGLLVTCNFRIADDASAGEQVLTTVSAASDTSSSRVAVRSTDGRITVQGSAAGVQSTQRGR